MSKTVIKVESYSGYRADERPKAITIMEKTLRVTGILDRWYGEGHDYFKVLAEDGYVYIIRHDRSGDEWDLVMMEKSGTGDAGQSPGVYSYNILISFSWRDFGRVRREIALILRECGDQQPVIEKTLARGICGVRTPLPAREVIKKVKALYEANPMNLAYTIKWAPADRWCEARIEEMKKTLEEEKGKINKGEKWAMVVEKRRYTGLHTAEIIRVLASLIDEPVDLDNPDKIVRVEILEKNACISVVRPDEVFSTARMHF